MTTAERDWASFAEPDDEGRLSMELAVDGIYCAACMTRIERSLSAVPGVERARVNLSNKRVAVSWRPEETDGSAIVSTLADLGYQARPFVRGQIDESYKRERNALFRALAVSGFAAMNVMLFSVSVWSGNVTDITPETRELFHWISALIALPAAAYAGQTFYRSAFNAISHGRLNMDVPITLGVMLALGLSFYGTLTASHDTYFESALMLLFFLLLGRTLDHTMRRRTRTYAENLAALRADTAFVLDADGGLKERPVADVTPGELVQVPAGTRVPVDGVVIEGRSEIDQSLVTGETMLQAIGVDDRVYAGTLNGEGTLTVRVSAAGEGTLLDEVNRLLDHAMTARSRSLALADKAARLYAPVVHTAALLTFLGWLALGAGAERSLVVAITVLIITCPCALALAVPAVQVTAAGAFFRNQLLLHAGDALERLAAVDTVVFDKTGTLTMPAARIANADSVPDAVLNAARALAGGSRHPVSVAIAASGKGTAAATDLREIAGAGIEGRVAGTSARLGTPAFAGAEEEAQALGAVFPDATLVGVRLEGLPPCVLAVQQVLRPDAASTVAALRRNGFDLRILSGDRAPAVQRAADSLGVSDWQAGLKPADKIAVLEALKAEGRSVLMVGDGLNDAPALAAADVSISPVTAVDLSQAAADVVFLGDRLAPVATALAIGRRARRLMNENLALAAIYNLIAVPIAVTGHASPLIAAVAMSASSILVTANALRAQRVPGQAEATVAATPAQGSAGEVAPA
ncbi:heavy metal translocating P-type ATPase [Amorphus orientalis]|uniref:Cu2+-exporting ATPase n=1 Tax=Amorphus orientalis TaxID=649198 RepID=A0AAE3VQ05_9HYPH|nr:heavy metal translocating P-type ATPase [Amorphus orientalis]MDQ0316172.1 Cu2+-exporting ATPase [Amorphus orientalis]